LGDPIYEGAGKGSAGAINQKTGPHPSETAKSGAGYAFNKGGSGLLKEMSCTWKTGGQAEPSCKDFAFKKLKVNLVSEQDLEADGGKKGKGSKKAKNTKRNKKPKTAVPGRGKGKGKGKKGK
jgi:hypothetical protein